MRAASLDRRVRKEATLLIRDARAALALKPELRGKGGDLATVTSDVEKGLREHDMKRVRYHLPILDALVDELVKRPPKSTTRDYVESIGAAILIALALRAFVIEAFKIPSSSMYPTLEVNDHIFVNKFLYGLRIPWTDIKLFQLRGPKRGEVIVFIKPCEPDRDFIKRVIATAGQTVEVRCDVVYVDGEPVSSTVTDPSCEYLDLPEGSTQWKPTACSRYRETVDGLTYDTFHDSDRPARDRRLTGPTGDDISHFGKYDFPKLDGAAEIRNYVCSPNIDPKTKSPLDAPNQKPGMMEWTKHTPNPCEQQLHFVVPEGHVFAMGDNRENSTDSRFWGAVPIENIKGKALFIWLSYQEFGLTGFRWSRIGSFVH